MVLLSLRVLLSDTGRLLELILVSYEIYCNVFSYAYLQSKCAKDFETELLAHSGHFLSFVGGRALASFSLLAPPFLEFC